MIEIDEAQYNAVVKDLMMVVRDYLSEQPKTPNSNWALLNALASCTGVVIAGAPPDQRDRLIEWMTNAIADATALTAKRFSTQ